MPKRRTRQQRRAAQRAPLKRKRRGSTGFVVFLMVLLLGGGGLIVLLRFNQPPLTRGAIAGEHWHAALKFDICGKHVTHFPNVEGEIHSHADGFMHIHPSTPAAAGDLASVGTFLRTYQTAFSQEKDKLTLTWPDGTSYTDGDRCKGSSRKWRFDVTNKGKEIEGDPGSFLPHNGDVILVRFGPAPKSNKDTMINPYAKANNLPDPGYTGSDTPGPDNAAPPEQPELPTGSEEPASSDEPSASPEVPEETD